MYHWGCCVGSLKGFQSRLIVRANTNVFLWCNIHMNFKHTDQDSIYLGLENSSIFSWRDTGPSSQRLPLTLAPVPPPPPHMLDQSVYQMSPLTAGGISGHVVHSSLINIVTPYLGSQLNAGLITLTTILNMGSDC